MTCVVALRVGNTIYMGADSAGITGYSLTIRRDPKIYRLRTASGDDMLIGYTTSFRMGQLLGYKLTPPDCGDMPIEQYMATAFVDAVRECLRSGGIVKRESEVESCGQFLVAYRDRIFTIESDFQVGESFDDYAAVGCGFILALGSLYTSQLHSVGTGFERVETALGAAARFSAGVHRPFRIQELT